jgi:hypothetical protein
MADKEYDIGYGKPPEETRFPKGKSGNPKGRPKGSRNTYKLLEDLLAQKVTITQDGKPVRIPKKVAILLQAVNSAIKGDLKAISAIIPHMLVSDAKNEALGRDTAELRKEDKELIKQFLKDHTDE